MTYAQKSKDKKSRTSEECNKKELKMITLIITIIIIIIIIIIMIIIMIIMTVIGKENHKKWQLKRL